MEHPCLKPPLWKSSDESSCSMSFSARKRRRLRNWETWRMISDRLFIEVGIGLGTPGANRRKNRQNMAKPVLVLPLVEATPCGSILSAPGHKSNGWRGDREWNHWHFSVKREDFTSVYLCLKPNPFWSFFCFLLFLLSLRIWKKHNFKLPKERQTIIGSTDR